MWAFVGNVDYQCTRCGSTGLISIEDFESECTGGSERGMGLEAYYDLDYQFNCIHCCQNIHLKFFVTEYPVDTLNFVDNQSSGATTRGTPEFEYLPEELYSARDILHLYGSVHELVSTLKTQPELIRELSPREFEEVVAEIFRSRGYTVALTKQTRDGGKDIIAIYSDKLGIKSKYFIECKHYSMSNKVDVDVVRALHGVKNTKDGPNKTIIATTSTFTGPARDYVQKEMPSIWDMTLADYSDIVNWLKDYDE